MSKPRAVMPDLSPADTAGSDVPLPPETMIVEARLLHSAPATIEPLRPGPPRLAISAGVVVVLFTLPYVVSKLFGN